MARKPTITMRFPFSEDELQFILSNTTVEQRCKALLLLAEANAGHTMHELAVQKILQDEFYQKYHALTGNLSQKEDQLLTVALPMTINADTMDVENFIVNVWQQPVTDDNYIEVGHAFKKWFKENHPEEYATKETMMFNSWR